MFPCSVAHLLELDWYGKLSILCSHEMTFSHEEKTGKYYEILDVCKKKNIQIMLIWLDGKSLVHYYKLFGKWLLKV